MTRAHRLIAIIACVATGLTACADDRAHADRNASYKGAKRVSLARIQFDDGDTFDIDGKPVRVLGIDTPEIADADVGILEDQPFGRAAAESTEVWMRRAKRIEVVKDGKDRYQRQLVHVFIDRELLAVRLLAHGLAYENVSHFGDNGFPDLADQILRAAHDGPKPAFEAPHRWRKKHQRAPATR